jgi:poly-gamma-glutamate synthesis protein (capsule biosynthesis protein)
MDEAQAAAPAMVQAPGGRVLVFAAALDSSGVGRDWAAGAHRPGVRRLPDLSPRTLDAMAREIARARRPRDVVVVSLHWGGNWGYEVSPAERRFARGLVEAGADVVHGHSSHHPKGIGWHRGRPILYGCGDFLNDYEGISGYEEFRSELRVMYFVDVTPDAQLARLETVTLRARRLRLERADAASCAWVDARGRAARGNARRAAVTVTGPARRTSRGCVRARRREGAPHRPIGRRGRGARCRESRARACAAASSGRRAAPSACRASRSAPPGAPPAPRRRKHP